CIQGLQTPRTF
nr:immunoglobulin light chain junction region [Macaca mulatta]